MQGPTDGHRLVPRLGIASHVYFSAVVSRYICMKPQRDHRDKMTSLTKAMRLRFLTSCAGGRHNMPHPHPLKLWLGGRVVRTLDLRSIDREFESRPLRYGVQPGQVVNTRVPLSPSSIIWYQPMGGDALSLGR